MVWEIKTRLYFNPRPLENAVDGILCVELWDFISDEEVKIISNKPRKPNPIIAAKKFIRKMAVIASNSRKIQKLIGITKIPLMVQWNFFSHFMTKFLIKMYFFFFCYSPYLLKVLPKRGTHLKTKKASGRVIY